MRLQERGGVRMERLQAALAAHDYNDAEAAMQV